MIIQFETAKLLKEKGFEQDIYPCYADDGKIHTWAYFSISNPNSNSYYAVEQYLIQKWLREIHNIEVLVYCNASGWMWELNKAMNLNSFAGGTHISWSEETGPNDSGEWDTYELALEAGIQEALKLI